MPSLLLKRQGAIRERIIEMLLGWNEKANFLESRRQMINAAHDYRQKGLDELEVMECDLVDASVKSIAEQLGLSLDRPSAIKLEWALKDLLREAYDIQDYRNELKQLPSI